MLWIEVLKLYEFILVVASRSLYWKFFTQSS